MKTKKYLKKITSTLLISTLAITTIPALNLQAANPYKVKIPYQFDFDENAVWFQYVGHFSEGLAAIRDESGKYDYKYGYIDTTGKFVIPHQFDSAEEFSDGLAYASDDSNYGYIDTTGKFVITDENGGNFSNGLVRTLNQNDKYGYMDTTGKLVIPYQFGAWTSNFSEGLACVKGENGKFGYIDTTGKLVIPYQFKFASNFSDGLAYVHNENYEFAFIDTTGKIVIPYGAISIDQGSGPGFSDGFLICYDAEPIILDKKGNTIAIPSNLEPMNGFSEGLAVVREYNTKNGVYKYGYIDTTGKLVIPCQFDVATNFYEGLALVKGNNGKFGYISSPYTKTGSSSQSTQDEQVTPTSQPVSQPASQPTVIFKGSPLNINGDILTLDNRTYYPLRDLLESVGATVQWDNATKTATGKLNGNTVRFTINQEQYTVNGQTVKMDNAKLLVSNGKTYIPVRYALEGLGFTVGWDNATSSITVN